MSNTGQGDVRLPLYSRRLLDLLELFGKLHVGADGGLVCHWIAISHHPDETIELTEERLAPDYRIDLDDFKASEADWQNALRQARALFARLEEGAGGGRVPLG